MLASRRGQQDVTVTVALHTQYVPLREQGDALVRLGAKVGHIAGTDDEMHAFISEPVESSFESHQATMGIADNADSHFWETFRLGCGAPSYSIPGKRRATKKTGPLCVAATCDVV